MWVHRKFIQFSNMHIFCLDQPIFYNVIDSYLFAAYLCDFSLCWIASESIKIMLYFNFFLKRQSKVCLNPSGTFANFFCVTVKQTFSAVTCHTSSFREEAGVDSPPPLQPRSCCQPLHHPCTAVRHSALVSSLQRCLILFCRTIKLSSYAGEVCLWDGGWHWELSWSRRKTSRLKMEHCCVGSHREMRQMHSPSLASVKSL